MANQNNWQKDFFEKTWEVQKSRKERPLTDAEMKAVALESGLTEEEFFETQRIFKAYLQKGDNYLEHHNWKDALEEYDEAYKLNPHHAKLLYSMALAYEKKFQKGIFKL